MLRTQSLNPKTLAFLGYNRQGKPNAKSFSCAGGYQQTVIRDACVSYLRSLPKKERTTEAAQDYVMERYQLELRDSTALLWAQDDGTNKPKCQIEDQRVIEICGHLLSGKSQKEISKLTQTSTSTISKIKLGKYRADLNQDLIGEFFATTQ